MMVFVLPRDAVNPLNCDINFQVREFTVVGNDVHVDVRVACDYSAYPSLPFYARAQSARATDAQVQQQANPRKT